MTFLSVHDTLGRRMAVLVDGDLPAGDHTISFNGAGLASGIYFIACERGGRVETRQGS